MSVDELEKLYQKIGACIWHVQCLENALHTLLALKVDVKLPGQIPEDEALESLAKHRRATLGTALSVANRHASLSAELLSELKLIKEERDWLVHRLVHQDGEDIDSGVGRIRVLSRLDELMEKTLSVKKQVINEVSRYCAIFGVFD